MELNFAIILKIVNLTLQDFDDTETTSTFLPIALDPGRKSVFQATLASENGPNQFRRCTTKEYYNFTGSTKIQAELTRKKRKTGIEDFEIRIPTSKATNIDTYKLYTRYMFTHLDALFNFYGPSSARDRFVLYQGRQKAPKLMVDLLVNGGRKYDRKKQNKKKKKKQKQKTKDSKKKAITNDESSRKRNSTKTNKFLSDQFNQYQQKVPLVIFDSGIFGKDNVKLKGNRCGVTDVFWRVLKKREADSGLIAVTIDEYLTSQICGACNYRTLKDVGNKGKSSLVCETCNKIW